MSDCETSTFQNDISDLPRSTYKRRSSIFQPAAWRTEEPKVTIDIDEDQADNNEENNEPESEFAASSESFDLAAYIEKLRDERKKWKETLNARKSRRRNLQKQSATIQRNGADFDLSTLTESERSFLLERPDYQRISKNVKTLAEAAVKVAVLDREHKVVNDRLTLKIKRKLQNATTEIIAMSTEI